MFFITKLCELVTKKFPKMSNQMFSKRVWNSSLKVQYKLPVKVSEKALP
jgi:hypothetical protein